MTNVSKNTNPEERKLASDYPEIIRKAKAEGHITIMALVSIMAANDAYDKILPELHNKFTTRTSMSSLKSPRYRWMYLLRRWTGREPDCVQNLLPGIDYLAIYYRNKKTGQFIQIDLSKEKPDYLCQNHYVNLVELAEYFKKIGLIYNIEIPFPNPLSEHTDVNPIKSDRQLLSCEPGTKWTDITITLIDSETVRIAMPNKPVARYTYHELGMKDRRTGKPTKLWGILLAFCLYNRITNDVIKKHSPEYGRTLIDDTKRLNAHFKEIFGIKESIFRGKYTAKEGYIPKINFQQQIDYVNKPEEQTDEIQSLFDEEVKSIVENLNMSDSAYLDSNQVDPE